MAREIHRKIPVVPIDADTSAADKKVDKLFNKIKGLNKIDIDANVSNAARRLETLVKRTNEQMSSNMINSMLKDFKVVLGAMKTEFDTFGDTSDIYKGLEKTCDMVESRFANLTISVDKKKISGLTEILNTVTELQSISDFDIGHVVPTQAVKNSQETFKNIKKTKADIKSIASSAEYITKTLSKSSDKAFSADKLKQYENKLNGLTAKLKEFEKIDDELIQNSLLSATSKINEALEQVNIKMPKAKSTAEILSTGETIKGLDVVEKKIKTIDEVTNRISKNSSISGLKNLEQEAVNVTKVLSEMYGEGISDTERYITLQYKLQKIFDKIGKSYGGVRTSGARDKSELIDFIVDGIQQRTGVNLFGDDELLSVMENLFGDSKFSLFNKSLSGLRMKDIAELLLVDGKTGDWVDLPKQISVEVEKVNDKLDDTKVNVDKINDAKRKSLELTKQVVAEQLKLTKTKNGYTALNGKYEIGQDADGWKVFQRDNAGTFNLIGTYKELDDVRKDSSLLTREEIVFTEEVVKGVKALQEVYQEMPPAIKGNIKVVELYTESLAQVKSGALEAGEAIGRLNELAVSGGFNGNASKLNMTSDYDGLVDYVSRYVEVSKKLWDAYDNQKDYMALAKERNDIIWDMAQLAPDNYKSAFVTMLQSVEMSRTYANSGPDKALAGIEKYLNTAHIENAYDDAYKKVNQLRDVLYEAEQEQEKLQKHAEVYGYTLGMAARQAGKVQKTLATNNRTQYVINMLKNGHSPIITNSGAYGFSRDDIGENVYDPILKTEYEFAQYLVEKIQELNVGWEDGLKILQYQNGELDKANEKVNTLGKELEAAHNNKEIAYDRMVYARHGIFGDEAIAANKKKLQQESHSNFTETVFNALKQIREFENQLRDVEYSDATTAQKFEKNREISAAISNISYTQFPYISNAIYDEDFNPTSATIDWATTDETLREMAESIAVYATTSKEALSDLKLIKVNTSGVELLNNELKDIVDNSGNAIVAYRGLANEIQSDSILTIGHNTGATWFSTEQSVANGYARGTDNLYSANLMSRRLLDIDANNAGWGNITLLGDGSDEVSKKITELYYQKQKLTEETKRLAEANKFESDEYKNTSALLRRVSADYEYYSKSKDNIYGTHDTNWYAEYAKENGYDAFRIKNVHDILQGGGVSDVIGIFNNEQLANVQKVVGAQIAAENQLSQAAQEAAEHAAAHAEAEKEVAAAVEKTIKAKKNLKKGTAKQLITAADFDDDLAEQVERLFEPDVNNMITNIREAAKQSKAAWLTEIADSEDLTNELSKVFQQAYDTIGDYKLKGKFPLELNKNMTEATVHLISKDESKTLDYVLRLKDGLLEIHDVKQKIGSTSFNIAHEVADANAKVDNLIANLKGRMLDGVSDLRNLASGIVDTESLRKFTDAFDIMQKKARTLSSNTVSGKGMNPLANSVNEMENADIIIDTYRKSLNRLGEVDGVSQATEQLNAMADAVNAFRKANNQAEEEQAYKAYSKAESKYKAYYGFAQESKREADASTKTIDNESKQIKDQYQTILDLVNKINAANSNLMNLQKADGGTGFLFTEIERVKAERESLISSLQSVTTDIGESLGSGFIMGDQYSLPSVSFLGDTSAISNFLSDTRTQAALTTEEIEKLVMALQKSQNIDIQQSSKLFDSFKQVGELGNKLEQYENQNILDMGNDFVQGVLRDYQQIMQARSMMLNGESFGTENAKQLEIVIERFLQYGKVLSDVTEKEAKYFSGKQKYSKEKTDTGAQDTSKQTSALLEARQKLEEAAKGITERESLGSPMFTQFVKGADGINRLDFSAIDHATGSLRTFRVEMGSVTKGVFEAETTIKQSMSAIQAAEKQMASVSVLTGKLTAADINTDSQAGVVHPAIQKLINARDALEQARVGGADDGTISKYTQDLKLAAVEVEKLYKQQIKLDDAINNSNGSIKYLDQGSSTGDIYNQLATAAQKLTETHSGASISLGKFDEAAKTLDVSLVKTNGTVETFKVSMSGLKDQITAQSTGIKQTTGAWSQFTSVIAGAGKRLVTALVGYNIFYKAISSVRKGIGYVKEIDLALTELKKVTDETQESYAKFIDTAASRSAEIGSTISAFTEASANFARLGYSMEESANMAETAIVYKNVADGLDTVDEATESIISTMKAFGIESNDTMGIIDRFNEVKFTCLPMW